LRLNALFNYLIKRSRKSREPAPKKKKRRKVLNSICVGISSDPRIVLSGRERFLTKTARAANSVLREGREEKTKTRTRSRPRWAAEESMLSEYY